MISKNDKTLLVVMANAGALDHAEPFIQSALPKLYQTFGDNLSMAVGGTNLSPIYPAGPLVQYITNGEKVLNLVGYDWDAYGGTDENAVLNAVFSKHGDEYKNVIYVTLALALWDWRNPEQVTKNHNLMMFHYEEPGFKYVVDQESVRLNAYLAGGNLAPTSWLDGFLQKYVV
jgi:hypothetical protein